MKAATAEFYAVKKKILAGKRKKNAKKNLLLNAARKSPPLHLQALRLAQSLFGAKKNLHHHRHRHRPLRLPLLQAKYAVRKRKSTRKDVVLI
ncbi:hypothetical protein AWM68_18910 [Fictibacillus phosphorivorans]|uniref:Uncharacterized protein n=1 Tax=Fictibacillus phosphorivorans TaxID=1221500 RepID=A0A161RUE8_9BACL|nr:hypothetical protein AWM68_18910 [Fictibacillus phosphorivorans]